MSKPLHTLRIDERERYHYTCPYLEDSTDCGLFIENDQHDEDACAYDGGDDGCSESHYGWAPVEGCALKAVAGDSFSLEEMGLDESFPVGVAVPVEVSWDSVSGYPIEAYPCLKIAGGLDE